MTRMVFAAAAAVLALGSAPAAMAASDYLLVIGGKDGVAPATIEILSWSWGTSNSGSVGPAGTGRLRESPTLPSRQYTARVGVAAGDVNGDGQADLAAASEVQGFALSLDKSSPQLATLCVRGNHIPQATIRARGETYELTDAVVSGCSSDQDASAAAGRPPRGNWDLATLKGARTANPAAGGACASGQCMNMTITGQMKHTKTGHVTLLK